MSLNEIELKLHCENILKLSRIRKKIVVLCEGDIQKKQTGLSPQVYKDMEQMPDANFYNACIPTWWKEYRPQFFNCGDRKDVLDTFLQLPEIHKQNIEKSYLEPDKLFAIVDLDIQQANINNYSFNNTEDIFYNLYDQGKVNESNSKKHRIWVTGLIHKEAYFLIPDIQSVFDDSLDVPNYVSNPIEIEKIYLEMVDELCQDAELQNYWERAFKRISHCFGTSCNSIDNFPPLWKCEYNKGKDIFENKQLILALLTIIKSKKYWNKIQPPSDSILTAQRFREMLSLEIGKFYSKQECSVENHIPFFFDTLNSFK